MAEVYFPELTEDHLTPFPRAPPPSPEMQPRSHSHILEIPASKFEGIGLDLRRNTFPLDEEDESPLSARHLSAMGYVDEQNSSPIFSRQFDNDDDDCSLPGSPQKRVCCSPCTLPSDFMTTALSSHSSFASSSGFGSYHTPLHNSKGVTGGAAAIGFTNHYKTHAQSDPPVHFCSSSCHDTTSHFVDGRCGLRDVMDSSTLRVEPVLIPSHTLMSRSYDLHSMHPHLPHSFETTQLLPEVRPTRSRTLDSSTTPSHNDHAPPRTRSQTLDANYGEEDPSQRKRKISVKRKNPDESDADPSLQFSFETFEYSYSSTGSSGESDWVMVDCKVESARPMEKKACCANDPSSVAMACRQEFLSASPLQSVSFSSLYGGRGDGGVPVPPLQQQHHQPNLLCLQGASATPFVVIPAHYAVQQEVGVVSDQMTPPTQQQAGLHVEAVTMMECEGKLDPFDVMDCEQLQTSSSADRIENDSAAVHQLTTHHQPMEQTPNVLVMRPHPRTGSAHHPHFPLRHSCVEEYLQPVHVHKHRGQGFGSGNEDMENAVDLDTRLNLSKSL